MRQNFEKNVRDVYGDMGNQWLEDLPRILGELSREWGLTFVRPFSNLTYHYVAEVKLADGPTAVLKMAPQGGSIGSEAKWYGCLTSGVPQLLNYNEKYHALLMERLTPGLTLKNLVKAGEDDSATRITSQIIKKLQSKQRLDSDFRHLSTLSRAFSALKGHIEERLVKKASSLFQDLSVARDTDVLLHGDLHHDNILSSGSEWKVIDPHGYIGDPAAEVGAMIRNPVDCFPKDRAVKMTIEGRLKILGEELPFDPEKMRAWAFCMSVLSAAWNAEDHGKIGAHQIEVVAALDEIVR